MISIASFGHEGTGVIGLESEKSWLLSETLTLRGSPFNNIATLTYKLTFIQFLFALKDCAILPDMSMTSSPFVTRRIHEDPY